MKARNRLASRNLVTEFIRCPNNQSAMFTFAIWSRFSPPEFPNVSSAVSFCSYHASVLHKSSFLWPQMRKIACRTCRHNSGTELSMRKGKNRSKSRKVIAFLRRCPDVCVTPELQDKRWRTQSSRGWYSPIVCATPTTRPSISRPWDVFQSVGTLPCHSRKDPHLDHGYAMTSHSIQGQTADRVLIQLDTELSAKCPSTVAWPTFLCRVHAAAGGSPGNTVIEVHNAQTGVGPLWYSTGTVNVAAKTIKWGTSIKYDNGFNPSIAASRTGLIEVHNGGSGAAVPLWYRIGARKGLKVTWQDSVEYATSGANPAIGYNGEAVLEVHNLNFGGVSPLWYDTATLLSGSITWDHSDSYDNGFNPAVSLPTNRTVGVEVHNGTSGEGALWYRIFTVTCN